MFNQNKSVCLLDAYSPHHLPGVTERFAEMSFVPFAGACITHRAEGADGENTRTHNRFVATVGCGDQQIIQGCNAY